MESGFKVLLEEDRRSCLLAPFFARYDLPLLTLHTLSFKSLKFLDLASNFRFSIL